ncbi:MAG: glucose-6-phosphate dehydrogenase assembly protein OpcA, partial [Nakamurella sp.]
QGRVLTLVIVTEEDSSEDPIAAANGASFEHPCRVIVVARGSRRGTARLDAQIRVGGDAGASEVIVLRLYGPLVDHGAAVVVPLLLADAPVVAWWPDESPDVPAQDPIGALAQRRITDSAAGKRPIAALTARRASYRAGDTDLAWTRLTNWRGLLAAALDQPPHEKVVEASVAGASDSASADLLAGWLALQLRCPVRRVKVDRVGSGLRSVSLVRRSGNISLVRPEGVTATLSVNNQAPRELALPRRNLRDCIAEELRRLDADEVFAEVLSKGLDLVAKTAAVDAGAPPKGGGGKDAGPKSAGAKVSAATAGSTAGSGGARSKATGPKPTTDRGSNATGAKTTTDRGSKATTKPTGRGSDATGPTAQQSPAATTGRRSAGVMSNIEVASGKTKSGPSPQQRVIKAVATATTAPDAAPNSVVESGIIVPRKRGGAQPSPSKATTTGATQ